jgi:hypothetical protein
VSGIDFNLLTNTKIMKVNICLYLTILLTIFLSCKSKNDSNYRSQSVSSILSRDTVPLTMDRGSIDPYSDELKFIKTASIHCQVQDVEHTTYRIEELVKNVRGYVSQSDLKSNKYNVKHTPISTDSMLETYHYKRENKMQIRVPNLYLDTVLRSVAHMAVFVDDRLIASDEVSLDLLSNAMKMDRHEQFDQNLTHGKSKSSSQKYHVEVEEKRMNNGNLSDMSLLSNLTLEDNIFYSTLDIHIYENEAMAHTTIASLDNVVLPSIGCQLSTAFINGWSYILKVLLFLISLWPFLFLLILCYRLRRHFPLPKANG